MGLIKVAQTEGEGRKKKKMTLYLGVRVWVDLQGTGNWSRSVGEEEGEVNRSKEGKRWRIRERRKGKSHAER